MIESVALSSVIAALSLLGVLCLLFPSRVRAFFLPWIGCGPLFKTGPIASYSKLMERFARSAQYSILLRLFGVLALGYCSLLVWVLVMHLRGR
jgi:hypothetical protein